MVILQTVNMRLAALVTLCLPYGRVTHHSKRRWGPLYTCRSQYRHGQMVQTVQIVAQSSQSGPPRAVHLMPVVTCLQAVIQLRLGYPPAKWRNVYKALTLLDFLLKRGPENCVRITKQDLLHRLQDLEGFQFVSTDGKDLGANVRLRCLRCLTLVYVVHKATEVLA